MLRNYTILPSSIMQFGVSYTQPSQPVPEKVAVDDPALQVLTDFKRVTAVIVLAGDTVDEAHSRMIKRSVRLLLVVDQERKVIGLITANDILGEKPMQVIAQRGIRREELLVRDVMTPRSGCRCSASMHCARPRSATSSPRSRRPDANTRWWWKPTAAGARRCVACFPRRK